MKVDPKQIEEACKELYIRALKMLPPDIKEGFKQLDSRESDATGKAILGTMIRNITVAEDTNNLLCQDTGIPIYNVTIGSNVEVDGYALKQAIIKGCERATKRAPAALVGGASDHAQERAHVLRPAGAGDQHRLRAGMPTCWRSR